MQKDILFVDAHSRLGLLKPPYGEHDANIGVEQGSEAILSTAFLGQFPQARVTSIQFTAPENVHAQQYLHTLASDYRSGISQITQHLPPNHTLVTVGGDHSVALTSIATILRRTDPDQTGVIMIDSHADIHQPSTSPSGNFHGMWLRPVIDRFENQEIDSLVPVKLPTRNVWYIGNLNIEPAESEFIDKHGCHVISREQLIFDSFLPRLEAFVRPLEHLHVSIDIDAFSHQYAPATGMMIEDGLCPEDVVPILEQLSAFPSLSVDLVEVNPLKAGASQTIQLAQRLLSLLLRS